MPRLPLLLLAATVGWMGCGGAEPLETGTAGAPGVTVREDTLDETLVLAFTLTRTGQELKAVNQMTGSYTHPLWQMTRRGGLSWRA
jgi:hypothetical protein